MPLSVEQLTSDSTDAEVQSRISESISQCMEEGGTEQKQCAAIAYDIARRQTGKELNYK
jgi:hypothetical protein